jgi:hypothetical protein
MPRDMLKGLAQHPFKRLVIASLLKDRHPTVRQVQEIINVASLGHSMWSSDSLNLLARLSPVNRKRDLIPLLTRPVRDVQEHVLEQFKQNDWQIRCGTRSPPPPNQRVELQAASSATWTLALTGWRGLSAPTYGRADARRSLTTGSCFPWPTAWAIGSNSLAIQTSAATASSRI